MPGSRGRILMVAALLSAAACAPDQPTAPGLEALGDVTADAQGCAVGTPLFRDLFAGSVIGPRWTVTGGTWRQRPRSLRGTWPIAAAQTDQGNLLLDPTLYPGGDWEVMTPVSSANPAVKFVFYNSAGNKYNFNFDRGLRLANAEVRVGNGLYQNRTYLTGLSAYSNGAQDMVMVRKSGPSFQLLVNGIAVAEFTDRAFGGIGRVGLGAYGPMQYSRFILCAPARSASQGRIVLTSTRAGSEDIWSMNPDGSGASQLTTAPLDEGFARWSPGGFRIAYGGRTAAGDFEVYTANADGSGQTAISLNAADDALPVWSPDGAYLLFASRRGSGVYGLYRMDPQGNGVTPIPTGGLESYSADLSPDGSQIVYSGVLGPQGSAIFVAAADGSSPIQIADGLPWAGVPRWSPDGQRVVFQKSLFGGTGSIWVINADGTGEIQLTSSGIDQHPTWAPDGNSILFTRWVAGLEQLFTMAPDGSNVQQVVSSSSRDLQPDWR